MRTFIIASVAALIALPAAAEQQITLKKADGVDKVGAPSVLDQDAIRWPISR